MDDFREWVKALLPARPYLQAVGDWVETATTATSFYCAVRAAGGPPPEGEVRRRRFSVVLLGRRNERADSQTLLQDVETLMAASIDGPYPCGVANIRATGEPVGPSFTTENRAWVKLTFEVTT